jgi:hypothetical protein
MSTNAKEDAKQEAEARRDGDGLKRFTLDGLLSLLGGLLCLVLGAAHLRGADPAHRRSEVLHVGPDRFDLGGQIVCVTVRAPFARIGCHGSVLPEEAWLLKP